MISLINSTKVVLVCLCAAGYYGTWHILMNNGTAKSMAHIRDLGPHLLPGTDQPLKTFYIGIPIIDYQLTVLAVFFWELVDGSHPAVSLFCYHFVTQVACGWPFLMIEGLRRGHRWKVISFIGTVGILVQNLTYAVTVPIYLIIYLSTSPLVSSTRKADFFIDTSDIAAIPISMMFGYIIPAVLMSLPAPSVMSFEQKQTCMAIWQMFPLWVAVFQAFLPSLISPFLRAAGSSPQQTTQRDLKSLRLLYTGLLVIAGIGQVSTFTLMAASKWFPDLFAPAFQGVFSPLKVFVPVTASPSIKMPSIGAGAHLLLQYDEFVGSASMAIFATVLYIVQHQKRRNSTNIASLLLSGVSAMILTGPLGYAVACVWVRDELVQGAVEGDDKKVN